MFKPVNDNSKALSEKIISQITDAIVKGELKPGDRLPAERQLSEQFRVSRTVIRDAVKILAGQGILQVKHGIGIFVAVPKESPLDSLNNIDFQGAAFSDLFAVRKVLETEAAEWAALRRKSHHLERLKEITKDASLHSDNPEVLEVRDAQFHVAIAEASQNLVMVKVMLALLDLLAKSRQESISVPGRALESIKDHERIVQAIEEQKPLEAKQEMLAHLNNVEKSILNIQKKN